MAFALKIGHVERLTTIRNKAFPMKRTKKTYMKYCLQDIMRIIGQELCSRIFRRKQKNEPVRDRRTNAHHHTINPYGLSVRPSI